MVLPPWLIRLCPGVAGNPGAIAPAWTPVFALALAFTPGSAAIARKCFSALEPRATATFMGRNVAFCLVCDLLLLLAALPGFFLAAFFAFLLAMTKPPTDQEASDPSGLTARAKPWQSAPVRRMEKN